MRRFLGQCTLSFPPMLVLEYCTLGNMRDFLRKVVLLLLHARPAAD